MKYLFATLLFALPLYAYFGFEEEETAFDQMDGDSTYHVNLSQNEKSFLHKVGSISFEGDCVEMNNGSHWHISPKHHHIVRKWKNENFLIITVNRSTNSQTDYPFCITHKDKKGNLTSVDAALYLGPIQDGPYTNWIQEIRREEGIIRLENMSKWIVAKPDRDNLLVWKKDDLVIIGVDDAWWNKTDHILINVRLNTYVRATGEE